MNSSKKHCNVTRTSMRNAVAIIALLLLPIGSVHAAITILTVETTTGFTFDRFTGTDSFTNVPMTLEIRMDNGGNSFQSQTWGINDLVSIELDVPSQSFNFFRDTTDFAYSFQTVSTGPIDAFSTFEITTDASGNIITRDMRVYYDLFGVFNDRGTPDPSDDFTSFFAPTFFAGSTTYQGQTEGGLPNFAITTFTESFAVVPEPSTSALLLALFAAVSVVVRQRGQRMS